jgi:RNA polymerase sigma-70 factor (ECF subfamily)
LSEADLILALCEGDEKAFRLLVDTYKKSVYNTVLGFVQDIYHAEELTQDVFITVFETIGSFKQQSKLSTWIYRVSINHALDFLRRAKRKKRFAIITSLLNGDNEVQYQPADFNHPGVVMENKEKAAVLFKAINRLPENQKTAFLLQKVQDCSQAQIAEIMALKEGAVESLLIRAKTNLKRMLINYYSV